MYRLGDYDDETLIEGMRALPPGHKLVVQVAPEGDRIVSVTVTPYWTLHVRYDDSYTQAQWEEQVAEEVLPGMPAGGCAAMRRWRPALRRAGFLLYGHGIVRADVRPGPAAHLYHQLSGRCLL